jgi:hypothetical protein
MAEIMPPMDENKLITPYDIGIDNFLRQWYMKREVEDKLLDEYLLSMVGSNQLHLVMQ